MIVPARRYGQLLGQIANLIRSTIDGLDDCFDLDFGQLAGRNLRTSYLESLIAGPGSTSELASTAVLARYGGSSPHLFVPSDFAKVLKRILVAQAFRINEQRLLLEHLFMKKYFKFESR